MAETTSIAWCDSTWSPWWGCTKVSPGCTHCYAADIAKRFRGLLYQKGQPRQLSADWELPRKLDRKAAKLGRRLKVFPSMCDVFDEEAPDPWRTDFFKLVCETPNLDWLVLTKRPANALPMMVRAGLYAVVNQYLPCPQQNLWVGTSVEDQARADERIPLLNECPAVVRFVSFEPLLGPIETEPNVHNLYGKIHWAILGGESGPRARPCDVDWICSLAEQCDCAGVAVFVKQASGPRPGMRGQIPDSIWALKQFPACAAGAITDAKEPHP